MTVRATPVKMVALALMASTPTSVSVVTAGRGPTVKPVSLWSFWGQTSLGLGRGRENQYEKLFFNGNSESKTPTIPAVGQHCPLPFCIC